MNSKVQREQYRVLLVDDDPDLLHLVGVRLKANAYEVTATDSAEKALTQLALFKPHVVVTDLKMPGMDGLELFREIQSRYFNLPVIVLTAHGTIPDAVTATQQGVFGYLVKPFDPKILLKNLENALHHSHTCLSHDNTIDQSWRRNIISCSQQMSALLLEAQAAAQSNASILIQSETGTGKELLAQAIHNASARSEKPFQALNCAAIPESLIESELFGHKAGSFTGANHAYPGLFQAANGGTVFLDEIGDMPLAAQTKLLRVLEQHEVRPVGATESVSIDVRIIAATHHNLLQMVEDATFREDLYYRLNVIRLELPPLRERRDDIPLLTEYFCRQVAERNNQKETRRFSPEALELLVSASWPGNIRQLYNVIEQCAVLSTTPIIPRSLVERSLRYKPSRLLGLNDARDQFERDYLVKLLNLTEGNIALAARLAERNRSEFYKLLKRHKLEPTEFRK